MVARAWVLLLCVALGAGKDKNRKGWFLLPNDDLALFEAFEYAIIRINEMRAGCSNFHLAPLQAEDYEVAEGYIKERGLYQLFKVRLTPRFGLAHAHIVVKVARQKSITDLSLFQVIMVEPNPCDLYSELDDAELLVAPEAKVAQRAKDAAMNMLNKQRGVLCSQRPQLQFIRLVSASVQTTQGYVLRLALELRESSHSFEGNSFSDVITVVYGIDRTVPSQTTVSPSVYPSRSPCDMRYVDDEQNAMSDRLRRRLNASASTWSLNASASKWSRPRRLAPKVGNAHNFRQFVDKGLEIPESFDPRLERTICFPRGFSRVQGSCGSSWAFAATAVTSFRECLWHLHRGKSSIGLSFLSAQHLVSCAYPQGCSGGTPSTAFYYLKRFGVASENCSPYRMRCFIDNSMVSADAADIDTSAPKSKNFAKSAGACPQKLHPGKSPCKCMPKVFHLTKPVPCPLLPNACEKVKVPHYFQIAGTGAGNTVAQLERHMMQEVFAEGPLYVSMLIYEDFFDPVCWTESGIHIHRHGDLMGKHAAAMVGWGTDPDGRDYWLLLNAWGNGWQQEGYFKVMRGTTELQITNYGAWGVDWTHAEADHSQPGITGVEVAFAPVMATEGAATPDRALNKVWLEISAMTDEPAELLGRVQGLADTATGEVRSKGYSTEHVLHIDLLKIGLVGERAQLELWAMDKSENTANFGPFTLDIPDEETFRTSQLRRLEAVVRKTPERNISEWLLV